jgi:hypothetical protein
MPACCRPADDARISGVLVGVGGPVGTAVQHWAGTIHLKGPVPTDVHTDSRGRFSQPVPAGPYRVTATSPSYDGGRGECRIAGPLRLRAHHTTHVRVVCQMK